jgi:hypothetical protein
MKPFSTKYFKEDFLLTFKNIINKFNFKIIKSDESSLFIANSKGGIWIFYEGHSLQYMYIEIKSDLKQHFYELFKSKNIIDKYETSPKKECLEKFAKRENFESEKFYYEDLCFAKSLSELIEQYFFDQFDCK